MIRLKKLLIILCMIFLPVKISFSIPLNIPVPKEILEGNLDEETLRFIIENEKINLFESEYEKEIEKVIKVFEKNETIEERVFQGKKLKINTGLSLRAEALLIAMAENKTDHVNEVILFYPKASAVVEYIPKIKKKSADRVQIINLTYDGNDELEKLHYGNRSYSKIKEELDKLAEKKVLNKVGKDEYENKHGGSIVIVEMENTYPPIRELYTHLNIEYIYIEYILSLEEDMTSNKKVLVITLF